MELIVWVAALVGGHGLTGRIGPLTWANAKSVPATRDCNESALCPVIYKQIKRVN